VNRKFIGAADEEGYILNLQETQKHPHFALWKQ